jgi:hypothetical protein
MRRTFSKNDPGFPTAQNAATLAGGASVSTAFFNETTRTGRICDLNIGRPEINLAISACSSLTPLAWSQRVITTQSARLSPSRASRNLP